VFSFRALGVLGENSKARSSITPDLLEVIAHRGDPFVVEAIETACTFGSIRDQAGFLEQPKMA
jgi:hypothetical protein